MILVRELTDAEIIAVLVKCDEEHTTAGEPVTTLPIRFARELFESARVQQQC